MEHAALRQEPPGPQPPRDPLIPGRPNAPDPVNRPRDLGRHLIGYRLVRTVPLARQRARDCEYLLAANGVFIRGRREWIPEAVVPVAAIQHGPVRGLRPLTPQARFALPRVDAHLVATMLDVARAAAAHDPPLEIVFHLMWQVQQGWALHVPDQEQSSAHCQPVGSGLLSYEQALIEVHSHQRLPAYFSATDDQDEQSFRVYAVLGRVQTARPEMRIRLGLRGHYLALPATAVFDMPPALCDVGCMSATTAWEVDGDVAGDRSADRALDGDLAVQPAAEHVQAESAACLMAATRPSHGPRRVWSGSMPTPWWPRRWVWPRQRGETDQLGISVLRRVGHSAREGDRRS